MDLYCRNSKCEYYSRPIQVKENLPKCPSCGHALLGGSINASASVDLPPPAPVPRAPEPLSPLSASPKTGGRSPGDAKSATIKRSLNPAGTGQKRDDPNLTRPIDGSMPVLNRKRRFVLELIEHGQACPMKFIDEVNTTPILVKGRDHTQRHVADLRYTPEGVELTPIGALSGFFVRINTPVRLTNGSRFRIGHYMIEVRVPPGSASADPASESREGVFPKDLVAQGELVFLRADGSDGLHFPILRKVLIGRGGPGDDPVDIPLLDSNVSRKHAAVGPGTHGLKLKNLSQSDGTFVEIKSPRLLVEGDRFRLGESLLQLVQYRGSS
jgi:FHA domain